jgi:hypothetical protein
VWWFVWLRRAELLRACCAKWLGTTRLRGVTFLSGHGRKFVGGYSVRQAVGSLRYRPQAQSRASSAVPTG